MDDAGERRGRIAEHVSEVKAILADEFDAGRPAALLGEVADFIATAGSGRSLIRQA